MTFEYILNHSPILTRLIYEKRYIMKTHGTFLEEPEFDLTTILNGSDGETIVAGA